MEEALQSEDDFVDAEYQGVSYRMQKRSPNAAAFVVLDDVLVYGQSEADVQKCIETHLKVNPSLLEDANYVNLDAEWKSKTNDLIGYVALDKVAETYIPLLKAFPGETEATRWLRLVLWLMENAESFNTSVALDTQGGKLDFLLGFKDDSSIHSFLTSKPQSLELLHFLPKDAWIAAGVTQNAEAIEQILMTLFDYLKQSNQNIPQIDIEEAQEKFIRSTLDFMAPLGREFAFALQSSGMSIFPNTVMLYEVTDEKTARDYMTSYATRLNETVEIYRMIGLDDFADAMSQIQPGPEEVYVGVQIQSIQLMEELPLPIPSPPSSQQQPMYLWYAFQSDKLLMSFGSDSTSLKQTLDVLTGKADGLNRAKNFEIVHRELPSEGNFSFYVAPLGYFKQVLQMMGQMGTPFPTDVLAELESGIALGVSAAVRDGGIASSLYASVNEVQQFAAAVSQLNQIAQASSPPPPGPPGFEQEGLVGRIAPNFTLQDLSGNEVNLADFQGKVVLLDFWATWCPPCVQEIPHLVELYEEYKEQGFEMVGISVDRDGIDVVKSFVEQHQVNYPILMDDRSVTQFYGGISSIPTTFLIDREGRIQKKYVGYRDKSVFEADIKTFLAEE